MIARLTGDLGQDMFTIASASIWAWKQDMEMVFVGDTPYNDSLFRGLTFSEPDPAHEELPYIEPVLADYIEYQDRIKGLFSLSGDDIEKVVAYAITLPEEPITVLYTTPLTDPEFCKEAMHDLGGTTVCIGDILLDKVELCPFTNPMLLLTLMIGADNLIIADDAFSWWGAFLNCREGCKVIGAEDTLYPLDNWYIL